MSAAMIAFGMIVLIVIIIAAVAGRPRRDSMSSFQFWSSDPAYGSSLTNANRRSPLSEGAPSPRQIPALSVSAAFVPSPAFGSSPALDGLYRWGHGQETPLWWAGPMARLWNADTPYFRNGPTSSYHGSVPFHLTR